MTDSPRYDEGGQRVTDCCGAYSTYFVASDDSEVLCCKKCWEEVAVGQGDGNEFREGVDADSYFAAAFATEVG